MNNLLLEIGVEEMPVKYIKPAVEALANNISEHLSDLRVDHGCVKTFSTPRRITVFIENIANEQKSVTKWICGPPEKIALNNNGEYTTSAIKFAEKIDVSIDQLVVKTTSKGHYISVKKTDYGKKTKELLENILPQLILSIPFPKSMKWSDLSIHFARPIRTIVAILGQAVLNFKLDDGINSGRCSTGHPFMSVGNLSISDPDEYLDIMRKAYVIANAKERRDMISTSINETIQKVGGKILADNDLLDIVTNLVEFPTTVVGNFDTVFLDIPREILVTTMREQQRFFSVIDEKNTLMPYFVAVSNIFSNKMSSIILGYERVLRARLSDAKFFYDSDVNEILESFESWIDRLKGILFHNELGSMHSKMLRIKSIASYLANKIDLHLAEKVVRAAHLCKADLVSRVVLEFPKLQGVMGSIYARINGESEEVSIAIREHYLPLSSSGETPLTKVGAIVSIADKIDSICGCFSIGLIPTGTTDPYGLRRQTIGLLKIARFMKLDLNFEKLVEKGVEKYKKNIPFSVVLKICNFIRKKLSGMLLKIGYSSNIVTSVISRMSSINVIEIEERIIAIEDFKSRGNLTHLNEIFKRIHNILHKSSSIPEVIDISKLLFEHDSEVELYQSYCDANKKITVYLTKRNFSEALVEMEKLYKPIDSFFNQVMVMVENKRICYNRLALLRAVHGMFFELADFSKIDL